MTPQQIGDFRLLERIGEGSMGEVYRAIDTMLEREVALKTLRPELLARADLVERFRVEAIALARLHHPHIAAIYAFFRADDRHHMAMQFVPGITLEERLRRQGRLPWQEAARVAADVLQALIHAHAQGVIHRDLKPGNLMVEPGGRVVVMDFGIARVLARGAGSGHEARNGAGKVVGTLEYIAPEGVRGSALPDARSDLYALGVVLFEAVTGHLPFESQDEAELMRAHLEEPPPRPSSLCADLPPALEAVILRALAKRPAQRHASAAAFLDALVQATGVELAAAPTPVPQPAPGPGLPSLHDRATWLPWARANPGYIAAAAALMLAAGLLLHSVTLHAPDRPGPAPQVVASNHPADGYGSSDPAPLTTPGPSPAPQRGLDGHEITGRSLD